MTKFCERWHSLDNFISDQESGWVELWTHRSGPVSQPQPVVLEASKDSRMGEENSGFRQLDSTGGPWRLIKYSFLGLTVPGLTSILAWTGLVTSFIFTITSTDLLFVPLAVGSTKCHKYRSHSFVCGVFYGTGVPGLIINVGFFVFSYKLWMKVKNNDIIGNFLMMLSLLFKIYVKLHKLFNLI